MLNICFVYAAQTHIELTLHMFVYTLVLKKKYFGGVDLTFMLTPQRLKSLRDSSI